MPRPRELLIATIGASDDDIIDFPSVKTGKMSIY